MSWPLEVTRLRQLVAQFPQLRIGLLGDLFLDRYLEIDTQEREWSLETKLEAYQINRVRNSPGALGTVINNLAALGVGRIVPLTVIGDDGHAYDLMKAMALLPVDTAGILRHGDRLTPTYTKPICPAQDGGWSERNRLDVRSRVPLSDGSHRELVQALEAVFPQCDGWIVLDQVPDIDCGVVDRRMRHVLLQLSKNYPEKLMLIDSREQLHEFACGVLKGNRHEFLGRRSTEESADLGSLVQSMRQLGHRTGRPTFCTVGEQGMIVAWSDGRWQQVPAFPVNGPIDIVGAGDAATSGLVATMLAGGTELEAATVGNLAASITVQQIGTTGVATTEQIVERLRDRTLSQ